MKPIFVTGIGTDIGKTVVATILVELLHADYWKPLQSGNINQLDSDFVRQMISNEKTVIHPERHVFSSAVSPHLAAEMDKKEIFLHDFKLPATSNHLIIEGAGGLMVPINEKHTILDLIQYLEAAVVVVNNYYLGSINHTLLTINALQQKRIPILGLIGNGDKNSASESIILAHGNIPLLGHVDKLDEMHPKAIKEATSKINKKLIINSIN